MLKHLYETVIQTGEQQFMTEFNIVAKELCENLLLIKLISD